MNRRTILTLSSIAAMGLAAPVRTAIAQQKTIKDQIVGTWTFVSALDVQPDGKKTDRWGANAKGIFMFDPHGHFAQCITRSAHRRLAPASRRIFHLNAAGRHCAYSASTD